MIRSASRCASASPLVTAAPDESGHISARNLHIDPGLFHLDDFAGYGRALLQACRSLERIGCELLKQLATDPFQAAAGLKKGATVTCEVIEVKEAGIDVKIAGTDVTAFIRRGGHERRGGGAARSRPNHPFALRSGERAHQRG